MDGEENVSASGKGQSYVLPASIIIAAVIIAGSIFYLVGSQKGGNGSGPTPVNNATSSASEEVMKITERDAIMGDPKAPVTIIEYGDYQCPFCARFFSQVEPMIRDQYVKTNKVKLVYRNFAFLDRVPGLPAGANESHDAAIAAECAKDQHAFWAYHDLLFQTEEADAKENSGNLNRALFLKLAGDLKLDVGAFTSCIDSKQYAKQVDDETQKGEAYGVSGTPASFVNGVFVNGAQPFEYTGPADARITPFKPLIESFLK